MTTSERTFNWWEGFGAVAIAGIAAFTVYMIEPTATPRPQTQAQAQQQTQAEAQAKPVDIEGCVTSDDGFRTENGVAGFKVVLKNSCEVQIRCVVNVNVINSRGANTGQQTMLLGAAAPGQYSQKSWMFNTGYAGGMANMSRKCQSV
jgi:hypothetical protein